MSMQDNARNWYQSILSMLAAYEEANKRGDVSLVEDAMETIYESVLSVQTRSGWKTPGTDWTPEEYSILLTTGGPALRIVGRLDEHAEPVTAHLEAQDWNTPWSDMAVSFDVDESVLVRFASFFYFGE